MTIRSAEGSELHQQRIGLPIAHLEGPPEISDGSSKIGVRAANPCALDALDFEGTRTAQFGAQSFPAFRPGETITLIGSRVTVGLMSVVMPGCEIGDDAVLAANAVLKKGTKIGPGEVWGGVPARRIGMRSEKPVENAPPVT